MTTIQTTRRRLEDVNQHVRQIDARLAAAEAAEATGEPALSGTEAARLLLKVERVASQLEKQVERLATRIDPLPPPVEEGAAP